MMALISFQPSVAISTGSRSGAAQKPPAQLTKGTPAGRLVRCGRMIADRNPDPLMNRGPFFCTDDQAKWLCEMPKCYTRQKKSVVQGWEQFTNGKYADEPGTYSCKTTPGERPFCNGCLYEGPNDQGLE
ncbi:hypothetical protein H4Q26_005660 [Puccinia striiformis f. sp. tritici PST-130]|nr:hypothetical protein H4Q26_005660 [Puccinia striiformis f. sp. tritici PST-130]